MGSQLARGRQCVILPNFPKTAWNQNNSDPLGRTYLKGWEHGDVLRRGCGMGECGIDSEWCRGAYLPWGLSARGGGECLPVSYRFFLSEDQGDG